MWEIPSPGDLDVTFWVFVEMSLSSEYGVALQVVIKNVGGGHIIENL